MNRRMEGSEVGMWERREENLEPGLAWPGMALKPVPPQPPSPCSLSGTQSLLLLLRPRWGSQRAPPVAT